MGCRPLCGQTGDEWLPQQLSALMLQVTADIERVSATLQVSAAPVFMLAAITSFLLVLTNRLQYLAGRLQILEQEIADAYTEKNLNINPVLLDRFQAFRQHLKKRINLTRRSMTFTGLSGLLIATDVGVLFFGAFTQLTIGIFVGSVFIAALACFQVALIIFLQELLSKHCIAELGPLLKHGDI